MNLVLNICTYLYNVLCCVNNKMCVASEYFHFTLIVGDTKCNLHFKVHYDRFCYIIYSSKLFGQNKLLKCLKCSHLDSKLKDSEVVWMCLSHDTWRTCYDHDHVKKQILSVYVFWPYSWTNNLLAEFVMLSNELLWESISYIQSLDTLYDGNKKRPFTKKADKMVLFCISVSNTWIYIYINAVIYSNY